MNTANPLPNMPSNRCILLAVDGSEHSSAAARLLSDLPCAAGRLIRVVAVMIPRQAANHAELEHALEQVQYLLEQQGCSVVTELLTGNPAEQIVQLADLVQPELIVLGARGRRATLGILLGGVAQQVVEYAHWPVLVVRAPYNHLRRVLVLTDGSPNARRVQDFLVNFLLPAGVDLRLAHVLPPIPTPELIARSWPVDLQVSGTMPIAEIEEGFQRQAELEELDGRRLLEDASEHLALAGLQVVPVLLRGDAATELIDYTREHEIDLIIAGSRGLGQVRGWLLGSVSRKLLHYAGCSVLIVRGKESD